MRIQSLATTFIAFFLPSHSSPVNIGKLALIGMLVTTFFLFTSGYVFPGGASHYPDWALAIVNGTKLPPGIAQREVGFPLLYLLGGFTFTHSFIGITLILAIFAVLMSILVYWPLSSVSPAIAFYMGLLCIISLSPFTYLKFFYPDQAYMFFNLLAVALLIKFIQSKDNFRFLYLFTVTALAASFTRSAGNLMYPVLLTMAYLMVGGRLRHYLISILIFGLAAGIYQWHRYEIFDVRHQQTIPSGKGMQALYPVYLYLRDFGVKLSPDLGPNVKHLQERLHEKLGSNVRDSGFIQKALPSTPEEFKEKYIYSYSPDQLIDKIFTEPNEEYFYIIVELAGTNDPFLLNIAKEIARAHPWYLVQYSSRNLWHALFRPGYTVPRYSTIGYIRAGIDFIPASPSWGVNSADPVDQYGQRAVNEMKYFPVTTAPPYIQKLFNAIKNVYVKNFRLYTFITSVFIIVAWVAAFLGVLSQFLYHRKFFQSLKEMGIGKLTAPIIISSTLVVYECLLTSVFCQPVNRYFHLTEPLRLVIVGFGISFLVSIISLRSRKNVAIPIKRFISNTQKYDLLNEYFSGRSKQWIFLIISVNIILFAWWVSSMVAHTT